MLRSPESHVKWFTDPTAFPTRYELLFSLPVLAALGIAGLAVAAAWAWEQRMPEPRTVKWLERFAPYAPLALGLHLGLALVVAAIVGILFAPAKNLEVGSENVFGFLILTAEAMCGLMIVLGLATRAAAILLALLGLIAMVPFSVESILEQVHIFGIAIFLFLVGRGPLSLDRVRGVTPPVTGAEIPRASLTLLRVMLGFAVFYGALTEKLLNPGLAEALLAERPYLNVTRLVGPLALPDSQFAFLAGVTELVIGAVIVSPWVTRPVMAIGALIFTASLFVFGWKELLGHFPFYGIFFLLFIAPKADSRRVQGAMQAQP